MFDVMFWAVFSAALSEVCSESDAVRCSDSDVSSVKFPGMLQERSSETKPQRVRALNSTAFQMWLPRYEQLSYEMTEPLELTAINLALGG